jgi:hypothetical protein
MLITSRLYLQLHNQEGDLYTPCHVRRHKPYHTLFLTTLEFSHTQAQKSNFPIRLYDGRPVLFKVLHTYQFHFIIKTSIG